MMIMMMVMIMMIMMMMIIITRTINSMIKKLGISNIKRSIY